MEFLGSIKEKIKDFFSNNSKLTVTVVLLLVLFVTAGLICAIVYEALKPEPLKKSSITEGGPFTPVEQLIEPSYVPLNESYYFSREPLPQWDKKEAELWFTPLQEDSLEKLKDANKKTANDILGAAP